MGIIDLIRVLAMLPFMLIGFLYSLSRHGFLAGSLAYNQLRKVLEADYD